MKKTMCVVLLAVFLVPFTVLKAEGPEFQFTIQSWATYTTFDVYDDAGELDKTTTQFGFGLRRARLRGKMTMGKVSAFIQYSARGNALLDANIDYKFSDKFMVRMGRFIGAGSQAGGRTSHTAIDFVERNIVGRNWAEMLGRGDYRTYGLSFIGKVGIVTYEVTAHNGTGDMNLRPYNNTSDNSDTATEFIPQMDFMVSANLTKCINAGFHYGMANEDRVNASSMTGFLYLQPKEYDAGSIRGKIDFAQVTDDDADLTAMGYGAMAFYKVNKKMEIGAGYHTWDPNTDGDFDEDGEGNITIGVNCSLTPENWKDSLLKFAAVIKTSQADDLPLDPYIFHVMWQVYMH